MVFADILLKPKNPDAGIIIELKYARSMNELDNACKRALEQIRERRYDSRAPGRWTERYPGVWNRVLQKALQGCG